MSVVEADSFSKDDGYATLGKFGDSSLDDTVWLPIVKGAAFALAMGLFTWVGNNAAKQTPRAQNGWLVVEFPIIYKFLAPSVLVFIFFGVAVSSGESDISIVDPGVGDIIAIIIAELLFMFFICTSLYFGFYRVEFTNTEIRRVWLWSTRTWPWTSALDLADFLGTPRLRFVSGERLYVSNMARGYQAFLEHAKQKSVKGSATDVSQ